jgi:ribosomal protein S6
MIKDYELMLILNPNQSADEANAMNDSLVALVT